MPLNLFREHTNMNVIVIPHLLPHVGAVVAPLGIFDVLLLIPPHRIVLLRERVDEIMIMVF